MAMSPISATQRSFLSSQKGQINQSAQAQQAQLIQRDQIRFSGTPKADLLVKQFTDAIDGQSRELAIEVANHPEFKFSLKDTYGNPLFKAIDNKDEALFDLLLTKLEKPSELKNASHLLEEAIKLKHWGIAKKLIDNGLDFRETRYSVPMAFFFPDTPEWADYLISKGLDVRGSLEGQIHEISRSGSGNYDVAFWAAATGRTNLLEKALEAGFNPEMVVKSSYPKYPDKRLLDVAISSPVVLKLLLDKGVKLRHPQHDYQELYEKPNLLKEIAICGFTESFNVVMLALQNSSEYSAEEKKAMFEDAFSATLYNVDSHTSRGNIEGCLKIVKNLLDAGCGRDASGQLKPNLMVHTIGTGRLLDTLVEAGININGRFWERDQTALMEIASHVNSQSTPERLQKLIALGADVNARDNRGWTALMYAMDTSRISHRQRFKREYIPKVAEVLQKAGAQLTLWDKAKLKLEVIKPTRILSRTLDNIFGGIRW
jgi:ankyrin repeat protein